MPELSAPVLHYRGLSQEECRDIARTDQRVGALENLGRHRSRFIRQRDVVDERQMWVGWSDPMALPIDLGTPTAASAAAAIAEFVQAFPVPVAASVAAASMRVDAPTDPEQTAALLQYRGLSQEEFRGFVLRNEMVDELAPLGRIRSRFIRPDVGGPATGPPPAPITLTESAVAAAVILLSAATELAVSASAASAASAPLGTGLLYPAASSVAGAIVALSAPLLLAASAASVSAASVTVSVAPFGQPLVLSAAAASASQLPVKVRVSLSLTADTVSDALADVAAGAVATAYTFDAIIIFDPKGRQVAEIARSLGPLETGHVDDLGNWVLAVDPMQVILQGFGISADGVPYYDTHGVDPGEEAELFIDPVGEQLWLAQ